MTTKLTGSIYRTAGVAKPDDDGVDREVIFGMEENEGQPVLTVRLKGLRTGWRVSLDSLASYITQLPREAGSDFEVKVNRPEVAARFTQQYNK